MLLNELKQELKQGIKRNLYIFTGEEREVMFKYIDRINPNEVRLDSFEKIKQYTSSASLFNLPMCFVIENDAEASQLSSQELLRHIKGHSIVLIYNSIDERKKLFKEMKKEIVSFDKYDTNFLIRYIQSYIDLNTDMARLVVERSKNNVAQVEQEIQKLKYYDGELTAGMLDMLIPEEPEGQIFRFIDVLMVRGGGTFELYKTLIEQGESPIKLLSLIHTRARQAFLVKPYAKLSNAEIAGKSGLTFFQVQKALESQHYWTMESLYRLMRDCQELEVRMKNGEIPLQLGFEALLVKIFTK